MDIASARHGDWTVLSPTGEIDISTASSLRDALTAAGREGEALVVVDLSLVSFIDSVGLGVLVGAVKATRLRAGQLVLSGLRPMQRKVFDVTGLSKVFTIVDTVDDATRSKP